MRKRCKRYENAKRNYDVDARYNPIEALSLMKRMATAKFDESIDLAVRLGIDPRKADQIVRGTVALPHGTGKDVRVAVFTQGAGIKAAEEAGADFAGGDELIAEVEGGMLAFDVAIASPDMMGKVGKLGKVLGPRGLMPNPKSGTVTPKVAEAVGEFKTGRLEYRNDRQGNVHLPVGKASFDVNKLFDNYMAVMEELYRAKPAPAKGQYVRNASLSSTMGPSVRLDLSNLMPSLD